jgi:hypothetical protein
MWRPRLSQVVVLGLIALCTNLLLAPNDARASCGDYVMLDQHHLPTTPDAHSVPKPCSGPSCSKSSLPLPATPPVIVQNVGPKAVLIVRTSPSAPVFVHRMSDDSVDKPVRRVTDINRPPS